MNEAVAAIEKANAAGVRVSATMYPYTAGGTGLAATLPLWVQEGGRDKMLERLKDPATRARARQEIETKLDGWENLLMAATFDGIQVASVPREFDQSIIGKRISADRRRAEGRSVGGLLSAADRQRRPHRRAVSHDERGGRRHGSARAVRDDRHRLVGAAQRKACSRRARRIRDRTARSRACSASTRATTRSVDCTTAVHRMTGAAAAQMGMRDRGLIRERYMADLVVFNPTTVKDTATYERPHQYPTGIEYVVVNGVTVLDPKGLTGARPGRPLYGPARQP